MRATQGVSFPRSGHAAIYHIARLYFGEALVYCDVNNTSHTHCGCECVPCVNSDRTFAKNHDFALLGPRGPGRKVYRSSPVLPAERYFIQYRSPVPAIASNYQLYKRSRQFRNRRALWQKFALKQVTYWNRFVDKWVLNFPVTARRPLYCSYEALVADPPKYVRQFLIFLSDNPLDEERLTAVMQRVPIAPRNSLSEFEFYDPVFFKEIENMVSHRLEKLGLPVFEEMYS